MQRNPDVHNDEGNPKFTRNLPCSQGEHSVTRIEHSQVAEVAEIGRDLEKRMRIV